MRNPSEGSQFDLSTAAGDDPLLSPPQELPRAAAARAKLPCSLHPWLSRAFHRSFCLEGEKGAFAAFGVGSELACARQLPSNGGGAQTRPMVQWWRRRGARGGNP